MWVAAGGCRAQSKEGVSWLLTVLRPISAEYLSRKIRVRHTVEKIGRTGVLTHQTAVSFVDPTLAFEALYARGALR